VVADVNERRARAVADAWGATVVAPDEIVASECDVLAPCALGGVVQVTDVPSLRCRAICGAANNQLGPDVDEVDDLLAERGIVYAPDFVANAGGIINIAQEFTGYSRSAALRAVETIGATATRVFASARERGVAPGRAATTIARERIAREGRGRWTPGSPTAWTRGAPLRELRPGSTRTRDRGATGQ